MTTLDVVLWVHLLAAAVWTGGLIALGFIVGAIRSHTDDREVLRAVARRFGLVSWVAFAIAIGSGLWMYTDLELPWKDFELKGSLIILALVLALVHQFTARRSTPAVRGILQVAILIVSIGIFGAAVILI